MSKMLQIRNVPTDLHRELKVRAASEGLTMSDFVLRELERTLQKPTRAEVFARIRQRGPVSVRPSPAAAVRAERQRR